MACVNERVATVLRCSTERETREDQRQKWNTDTEENILNAVREQFIGNVRIFVHHRTEIEMIPVWVGRQLTWLRLSWLMRDIWVWMGENSESISAICSELFGTAI